MVDLVDEVDHYPGFPKQMSAMNYPESSHALTRKPITSGENLTLGTLCQGPFWVD